MGKNKIVSLVYLWLWLGVYFSASSQPTRREYAGQIAKRAMYFASLGITEKSNNNDGKPYDLFMQPYGFPAGTKWCGLFAMRCHFDNKLIPYVEYPPRAASWYIKTRVISKYGVSVNGQVPIAGDVAIYSFGGKRIDHAEVLVEWSSDTKVRNMVTVGGNTSAPSSYFIKRGIPIPPNGRYPRVEGCFIQVRPKSSCIVVRVELIQMT